MKVQSFKTPNGDEMVILSRAEYEAILARIEEAEEDAADVAAYDAAKAADGGRESRQIPPDEMRGHYLRMARKNLGLTQTELAAQTALAQGYISDLESGRRRPSGDAFARIAAALAIDGPAMEDLRNGYGLSHSGYSRICDPLPSNGS